jgi:hypothetical protein
LPFIAFAVTFPMPNRFTQTFTAGPEHIDIMGHVNNAVGAMDGGDRHRALGGRRTRSMWSITSGW